MILCSLIIRIAQSDSIVFFLSYKKLFVPLKSFTGHLKK